MLILTPMVLKLLVAILIFSFQWEASAAIEKLRIRKDIEFLASDELKGRLSGTPEARKAAEYIAAGFKKAGLQHPPGYDGPFQQFEFTSGVSLGKNNSLSFHDVSYVLKKDFIPVGFSEDANLKELPVVFAGYCIRSPEPKHDDFADVDVKGKIVLCYRFGPEGDDPKSPFSRYYPVRFKAITARDAGAAALVVIADNEKQDSLLELRQDSTFGTAGIPVFSVKRDVVLTWLQTAGMQMPSAKNPHASMSFELPRVKVSLTSNLIREKAKSENVMGWLPAAQSTQETLIIGAHYDHLGLGIEGSLSQKRNVVHNGADDNASGVAGLLELARHFGSRKDRLQRNILFVAFGAEELGVLGSSHFVKNSPVRLENIVAMLNMDMIGRLRNQKLLVGGTGTAPEWKEILNGLNGNRLKLTFNEDGYGPSDHSVFYGKNIPVLFFFTGAHPEYHKPEDDPERIAYEGMVAVVDYVSRISENILALPSRPKFVRVKTPASRGVATGGFNVYLGTIPDYAEEVKGVKLSGVREGSPAERAGMKSGDVIVDFAGKKIENVYDYTYALQQHKPDEVVTVIVLRDGKRLPLQITLASRTSN